MVNIRKPPATPHDWLELARGMGDTNWQRRRQTVQRLGQESAAEIVQYVLHVLREEHRDFARVNGAIQILIHTPADVVPSLLELLNSPDPDIRSYAALTLGQRGDPRAIDDLMRALSDSNANVRTQSIEALGKLRAGAAVDQLIEWVKSRDFSHGFPALHALIEIGDERIVEHLYPLLADSLWKAEAVAALGQLGNERSVQPLVDLLLDPELDPQSILRSLAILDRKQRGRYGTSEIPQQVGQWSNSAVIDRVTAAASTARETNVVDVATVVSWLPGQQADVILGQLLERWPSKEELIDLLAARDQIRPVLLEHLRTATGECRTRILQVLVRVADRECVPELLEAIEIEEDEEIVAHVIEGLAKIGDQRLYPVALRRLGDPRSLVRSAAVSALISLEHPDTIRALDSSLRDASPQVREAAIKAAAHWVECRDFIFAACRDPDEHVRRAAIEQIVRFDDPRVIPCLTQAIRADSSSVRAAAAVSLSKCTALDVAAQLLADALRDDDVWVRYFAVRCCTAIHRIEEVFPDLLQLATMDSATQVRIAAIDALAQCGTAAYRTLVELSASSDLEIAAAAISGLSRTGHAETISHLAQLAQSDEQAIALHAIRALATPADERAVSVLREFALDRAYPQASEAISALTLMNTPEAAWALVEAASWPSRRCACIAALVRMSDAAIPALARGLRSMGLDTRRAIVEVLSQTRTRQGIGILETALTDPGPAIQYAASTALTYLRHIGRTTIGLSVFEGGN